MVLRRIAFAMLACCALFHSALPAQLIHLKSRTVRTGEVPSGVHPPIHRLGSHRHLIVQFETPWNSETIARLRDRGIAISSAIDRYALMLGVADAESLEGLGIKWTGELNANDKLSPAIETAGAASNGFIVEFHKEVPAPEVDRVLRLNQIAMLPAPHIQPNHRLVKSSRQQLQKLARWDEVAYIIPAPAGISSSDGPRPCAGALLQGIMAADYVTEGTGWAARNAFGVPLEYVFTTLTNDVPANKVQTEILRAMHAWSAITNVQFTAGVNSAATATVAIEFGTSVNNDPTPFDPSGSVLAHTYYPDPPNPEPIAGDMHFNPAVSWNVGAATDIYTVALHELGHALGLGHTDNPSDVMYPYYQFGVQLSSNDIAGVQALYGALGNPVPAAGGGNPNPGGNPQTATSPLSLLIASPANGLVTTASTATLSGSLVNATGPATIVWRSSSGAAGSASGSPAWSTTSIPLSPGINLITVTATEGPQQSAAGLLRILQVGAIPNPIPNPPPNPQPNPQPSPPPVPQPPPAAASMAVTYPTDGFVTTASSITVTGTASDPSGIASVTWTSNSGSSGTATGTTSWSIPSLAIYPGDNLILIYAFSNSGSRQWAAVEIIRQ